MTDASENYRVRSDTVWTLCVYMCLCVRACVCARARARAFPIYQRTVLTCASRHLTHASSAMCVVYLHGVLSKFRVYLGFVTLYHMLAEVTHSDL